MLIQLERQEARCIFGRFQLISPVLRIRADFFRIRIRIRGSGFKISDPDPDPDPYGHPFFILK